MPHLNSTATLRLGIIPVLLLFVSCSVWEDRRPCPCALTVDLSKVADVSGQGQGVRVDAEGTNGWRESRSFEAGECPKSTTFDIPKGSCSILTMLGGSTQIHRHPFTFMAPEGEDMDPVCVSLDTLTLSWEECTVPVSLRKDYAEITVRLGDGFSREDWDWSVEISGDVCGVRLYDGVPIDGVFRCRKTAKDKDVSIRVPRQKDRSLTMAVYKEDAVISRYDIGQLLSEHSYDWSCSVLSDMTVVFSYKEQPGITSVLKWQQGGTVYEIFN